MALRRRFTNKNGNKDSITEKNVLLEQAWRLFEQQHRWTERVDTKAGFFLTLLTAMATASFYVTETLFKFTANNCLAKLLFIFGIVAIVVAASICSTVVIPKLRSKDLAAEYRNNYIYFGHAREWKADDLAKRISESDLYAQLCRQIVLLAKINWDKHRRIQRAFHWAATGFACLAGAAISNFFK